MWAFICNVYGLSLSLYKVSFFDWTLLVKACMKWSGLAEKSHRKLNVSSWVNSPGSLPTLLPRGASDHHHFIIILVRDEGPRNKIIWVDVDHWLDIHKNESLEWNGWKHACVLFAQILFVAEFINSDDTQCLYIALFGIKKLDTCLQLREVKCHPTFITSFFTRNRLLNEATSNQPPPIL